MYVDCKGDSAEAQTEAAGTCGAAWRQGSCRGKKTHKLCLRLFEMPANVLMSGHLMTGNMNFGQVELNGLGSLFGLGPREEALAGLHLSAGMLAEWLHPSFQWVCSHPGIHTFLRDGLWGAA